MNAPRTWPGFLNEVLARNEGASGVVKATFDMRTQPGASTTWFAYATAQFSPWFLLLALAGTAALALADRRALAVVVAGTFRGLLFAYRYRTDLCVDRYMLVSFAVAAALMRLDIPRVRPAHLALIATIVLSVLAADTWLNNRASLRRASAQWKSTAHRRGTPRCAGRRNRGSPKGHRYIAGLWSSSRARTGLTHHRFCMANRTFRRLRAMVAPASRRHLCR
jgi:hypothetical protein